MTAATPSVTVIIATYNWSNVLPYSIGSVLRQTFTDFELLVVGDGCTDDSEAVVQSMNDARLRWINLPANTGHQSDPNNEGLRQARGEFIAYLGHDDLWLPHHVACHVAALAGGAAVSQSVAMMVGADGISTEPAPRRVLRYRPPRNMPPSCVVHRRSVTEDLGGWRNYRELTVPPEADLWRRAFESGRPFAFVPRLTAVKFPAARRRDVYKTRPNFEQAAWSERIRTESEFEALELVKMLAAAELARLESEPSEPPEFRDVLRRFVRETTRRIRYKFRKPSEPAPRMGKGERIDARREFKGLERKP